MTVFIDTNVILGIHVIAAMSRDMAACRFLDVIEYEHLSLRCVSS